MLANFKASRWYDGAREIEIPAGSFVTSYENLASFCRLTVRQVRGCLAYLEKSKMVAKVASYRHTIVTIQNWATYQGSGDERGIDDGIARVTSRAKLRSLASHSEGRIGATEEQREQGNTKAARQKRAVCAPSLTPQQAEWLEQWWTAFWKHKNKVGAKRAFSEKITTVELFERVMAATSAQGAEMMERAERYRTGGAAYLLDERFNDPLPAASKTNADFDYVVLT